MLMFTTVCSGVFSGAYARGTRRIGRCIPHPPWGGFSKLDCSAKRGADIERCRLRKVFGEYVSHADLFGTGTVPTMEYTNHGKIGPGGCDSVAYTVVYGTRV